MVIECSAGVSGGMYGLEWKDRRAHSVSYWAGISQARSDTWPEILGLAQQCVGRYGAGHRGRNLGNR